MTDPKTNPYRSAPAEDAATIDVPDDADDEDDEDDRAGVRTTPYLGSTVEIEVWSRALAGALADGSDAGFAAAVADAAVLLFRQRIGQAERWADLRKAGETLVHEQRDALLALTGGVPTEDQNLLRVYAALDEFAKVLRGG